MPVPASAVAVVLLAPALDAGASAAAAGPLHAPGPAGAAGMPGGARPAGATGPDMPSEASVDPLAAAAGDGMFERRALDARPWEARLMTALGLLDAAVPSAVARAAVPAARLLGPDDLADAPPSAAGDVAAVAAAGRLVVADPVSLTPGRDEATLTPPEALALTPAESDALIGSANALLAEDGVALLRGASGRWYLAGLDADALDTPPAHFLARGEAGAHLPGAVETAAWRRLMTELQMLWHADPVNEARAARGLPPVNGVWFWGGAAIPDAIAPAPAPTVVARDALAVALARHAGATLVAAEAFDAALAEAGGDTLLVVDTETYAAWLADDAPALEAARARLLEHWLVPAVRAVRDGRAASLVVAGGDGTEAVFRPPPRRSWFARLLGRGGR